MRFLWLLVILAALAGGCSRSGTQVATSELENSFKAAAPAARSADQSIPLQPRDEVQQIVNQAVSAMKTNAYVEAAAALQVLKNQSVLTPDQRIAVQNASVAVLAKVAEAADRGDPAAIRAVEAIKGMPRR
jgi:hypothetical protein